MNISRQNLYAAGEPLGDSATRIEAHRLILGGGGSSSGQKNYKNLEKLYGEQAASARLLRGLAEQNLPGATADYMRRVNTVQDEGYAETQANKAATDAGSAAGMERAATERSMASMGVNPNDPRFAGSMRAAETSNAAQMAASKNIARGDAEKYQHAVAQDAIGTFTGQSNSAAAQMSGATSGMSNLAAQQQQAQMNKQAQQQNAVSNAVGGGMALWNALADGGKVLRPQGIKRIERHMLGGGAGTQQHGFFGQQQVVEQAPPAQQQQPQQSPVNAQSFKAANKAVGGKEGSILDRMKMRGAENMEKFGKLAKFGSEQAGRDIYSHAAGMRMTGEQTQAASKAYEAAASQATDPAMQQQYLDVAANMRAGGGMEGVASMAPEAGSAIGSTAGAAAGETAGAMAGDALMSTGIDALATNAVAETALAGLAEGAAAGAATAGAGATGTASGVASALGAGAAALPWVGAAAAVGSLLGIFKDGGKVHEVHEVHPSIPEREPDWREGPKNVPPLGDGMVRDTAKALTGRARRLQDEEDRALGIRPAKLADGGNVDPSIPEREPDWREGPKKAPPLGDGMVRDAAKDLRSRTRRLREEEDRQLGITPVKFADGGQAEYSRAFASDVQDFEDGDKVPGEWEGNTDKVPALLTEAEQVVNAEGVALAGDELFDRINAEGLKLRRRGLDPKRIRGLGLKLNIEQVSA